MDEAQTSKKIELSEVMLAMDVVDTLRHEQSLVDRELRSEDRETELITKLRKIYKDQGLDVSEEVIIQGVQAMREDRFAYQPQPGGLQTMLAKIYVARGKWAKRVALLVLVFIGLWTGYRYLFVMPEERNRQQLVEISKTIESLRTEALKAVVEPGADIKIESIANDGLTAVKAGDLKTADTAYQALQAANVALNQEYTVQIVSRPGTPSGVWRYPTDSKTARNYYLIVEAISPSGQRLQLPITSEEDGSIRNVSQWGLRVEPQVFERVKKDKTADGIVNDKIVGKKQRGTLAPTYTLATSGAAITQW